MGKNSHGKRLRISDSSEIGSWEKKNRGYKSGNQKELMQLGGIELASTAIPWDLNPSWEP
jgi:hypothetical protein